MGAVSRSGRTTTSWRDEARPNSSAPHTGNRRAEEWRSSRLSWPGVRILGRPAVAPRWSGRRALARRRPPRCGYSRRALPGRAARRGRWPACWETTAAARLRFPGPGCTGEAPAHRSRTKMYHGNSDRLEAGEGQRPLGVGRSSGIPSTLTRGQSSVARSRERWHRTRPPSARPFGAWCPPRFPGAGAASA